MRRIASSPTLRWRGEIIAVMMGLGALLLLCAWAAAGAAAPRKVHSRGSGKPFDIFTVAGLPASWKGPRDERALATAAAISPTGVVARAADGSVLTLSGEVVRRIAVDGRIDSVAGRGPARSSGGYGGDGGSATGALLSHPASVAAMSDGGFVVADSGNARVRRVWPDGHISTVAGNGRAGFSGDGAPATAAQLNDPEGVAALPDGGLLIADSGNERVRRVWPDGHISTIAGNGQAGFSGDGGPATAAELGLSQTSGVAALADGGFLIGDTDSFRVRRVWPDGHISTVAGGGNVPATDGSVATAVSLGRPGGVAALPDGGFLIADTYCHVWRVSPDDHISTVAGNGQQGFSGDGGPAVAAEACPYGVAALPNGGILIADTESNRVRRVWPDGHISTVAGAGLTFWQSPGGGPQPQQDFAGEGGPATAARLKLPGAVAVLPDGGFLIADTGNDGVRRVWPDGHISTVAGSGDVHFYGDGGPASAAQLDSPSGLAALPDGGFLIADTANNRVRRVFPDGHISTVAGDGHAGFVGDGGPATAAQLNSPSGLAALPDGGFLIADTANSRVRRVFPDGHISTVAGDGHAGFVGDGGPATAARLHSPSGLAALPDGGFLIADTANSRVRRVFPDGHISTVAGDGHAGFVGDGGPATAARLHSPSGLAALPDGGFLIADTRNNRVRRVFPDGHIFTIAGNGRHITSLFYGDGGPATSAPLDSPSSISTSRQGSVLVGTSDSVRLLVPSRGAVGLLAAAIRPLMGTISHGSFTVHLGLTKTSRLTARLYRSPVSKPALTLRAVRGAGPSMLTLRGSLPARVYALDLRASTRSQTARTSQWLYLGDRLTTNFILRLQTAEIGYAPDKQTTATVASPVEAPGECHQFGPDRVDCVWSLSGCDFVQASVLTQQGLIYSRRYGCPTRRQPGLFKRYPRWTQPRVWEDLRPAWH